MAETVSGGWQGVVLPSNMPSYGETLQMGIQNSARQGEQTLRLAEQKQKDAEQRRLGNLRLIGQDTDFDQFKTGEQHIDDYAIGELKKISDKALTDYINLPPEELQYRLQNDLNPLFKWHTAAQGEYAKLNGALTDLNKTYPNIDLGQARQLGNQAFVSNMMQQDQNGNMIRKNTQDLNPVDYNGIFQNPQSLAGMVNDISPLQNYYHGLEKNMVHDSDFVSNKGYSNKYKWSAYVTPATQVSFDASGKPFVEPKNTTLEGVKDENGNPMKILDGKILSTMMQIPTVGISLRSKWEAAKPAIEAAYMKRTGNRIDPTTEGYLFSHFAYLDAKDNLPHDVSFDKSEVVPRPQVNIYNNANASPAAQWVNDMYSAAASGNEDYVKGVASQLFSGLGKNEFEGDVFYLDAEKSGNGRPAIQIDYKGQIPNKKGEMKLGHDYERIYLDDPNIKTKLAGLYQKIMGATGKVEDANFYKSQQPIMQGNKPSNQGNKKAVYKGLDKDGNPIFE
jgi:hypothetical protein